MRASARAASRAAAPLACCFSSSRRPLTCASRACARSCAAACARLDCSSRCRSEARSASLRPASSLSRASAYRASAASRDATARRDAASGVATGSLPWWNGSRCAVVDVPDVLGWCVLSASIAGRLTARKDASSARVLRSSAANSPAPCPDTTSACFQRPPAAAGWLESPIAGAAVGGSLRPSFKAPARESTRSSTLESVRIKADP